MIAPYREDGLELNDYKALIAAAATAWNLTSCPRTNEDPLYARRSVTSRPRTSMSPCACSTT